MKENEGTVMEGFYTPGPKVVYAMAIPNYKGGWETCLAAENPHITFHSPKI